MSKQIHKVRLMMTEVHEGKQPAVWVVDPYCTPSPATGWVNDILDVPGSQETGQIVLILVAEGATADAQELIETT